MGGWNSAANSFGWCGRFAVETGQRMRNENFRAIYSIPKGCYEPWGIFRKALPAKMTVSQCLRESRPAACGATTDDKPFDDVIPSERTPRNRHRGPSESKTAIPSAQDRPCRPSAWGRHYRRSVHGFRFDDCGGRSRRRSRIGIERHRSYFEMARNAIPQSALSKFRRWIERWEQAAIKEAYSSPRGISSSLPFSHFRFE